MSEGSAARVDSGIPSLTWTTIHRTLVIGRLYLAIGTGVSLLLTLILVFGAHSSTAFVQTFPLEVPLFAVLGSIGGLMTFTSDRTKGVFEYLIAYGIRPRTLFINGLLSAAALTGLILGFALMVGLGLAAAEGVLLTPDLWKSIVLYTIPMSFAGALFTATVGMIWSSLSSPRTGINSPVGIAPMVGIAPTLLVLIVAETGPSSQFYYVTVGAAAVIIVGVVILLGLSGRLMGRERFVSPL
ncbi:MAG TPA: hypothetical protein VMV28_05595 [Thermoplasmata archaeon]|nr:hypothetical protein [Thermoplasmata archaeon]